MKYSIRRQLVAIFIGIIVLILAAIYFVNTIFLERFYLLHKQEDLRRLYYAMEQALYLDEDGLYEEKPELQKMIERYNISVLVMSFDFKEVVIHGGINSPGFLQTLLFGHIARSITTPDDLFYQFIRYEHPPEILYESEQYALLKVEDWLTGLDYLEKWGQFPQGFRFLIRSPLEGIRESAALANNFLLYVGLVGVFVGGILVWFFANRITKPLQELAKLSRRMSTLDFEARYKGGGNNEIAVLGDSFNQMSRQLESTLSELKGANNQLVKDIEHKEKMADMQSELLGNVSHELKTPIALIQGYAEGLREGIHEDLENRQFYCDVIIDETLKMNQMVKNLLTLNQLEYGSDELQFTRFNIVEMIRSVLNSCEILIQQAAVKVDFIAGKDLYVWADEFKTEQVLLNYLTNAINHVKNEKRIEIRIVSRGNVLRISVFNSGNPIPEEDIPKIWDKFFKVDKSHSRAYGGNGIGLSIVQAIMKSFHQDYGVRNFANGVEFWFELDAGVISQEVENV